MDFENMDPLAECGARWTALRNACQAHAQARAQAQEELRATRQVEATRHETQMRLIKDEHINASAQCERILNDAQEQAREQAALALRTIDDQSRAQQAEIQSKFKDSSQSAKQHLDEAIWLADSVLETGESAPRIEFEETRARILQIQSTLNESFEAARLLLKRYRQAQPLPQPMESALTPKSCETILSIQAGVAMDSVKQFRKLKLAGLFRGPILLVPTIILTATIVGVAAIAGLRGGALIGAAACGIILSAVGIVALWFLARRQVRQAWIPISNAHQIGQAAAQIAMQLAHEHRHTTTTAAIAARDHEVKGAKSKWTPILDDVLAQRRRILEQLKQTRKQKISDVEIKKTKALESALAVAQATRKQVDSAAISRESQENAKHNHNQSQFDALEKSHMQQRCDLWRKERDRFQAWTQSMAEQSQSLMAPWEQCALALKVPRQFTGGMSFGELALDLRTGTHSTPTEADCAWSNVAQDAPAWTIPAFRSITNAPSLLLEAPLQARAQALEIMQCAALRLLTQTPAGKVRFYLFDPVGLGQSFAGFMHLADQMESLVSERIWSEARHIEQKLTDLTEYVETVIQKYLRNEFQTIADYNLQAGELAEPLRVVVFADFPEGLSDAASKRFASLLQSGARCGVHFLLLRDPSKPLPGLIKENEILQHCARVCWKEDRFVVDVPGLEDVPFTPATMPSAAVLQDILQHVGRAAKAGSRVEVPFQAIEPKADQRWTSSSAKLLRVPVGRSGANKLQCVEIGEGTRQHVLLAGKTGSGKSTLLHALITNVALWYSPDEIELWLIDFKKGVEFKAYATHALPHARAVAVESDREFGLSVLQGLDVELKRRGDLFRDAGVQDLAAWRLLGKKESMPRTMLIVDEFQELFVEEDKVAQDSSLLLDRLVRQGRAFGMHVILGSQTLGGTYALPRTTMGQMGIRIALQCNEADSAMILSDDNTAARLLSRPGEAIYNDAGGLIEGNSPFQVVWLTDAQRDERVRELATAARAQGIAQRTMIVFDGTAAARIEQCQPLRDVIKQPADKGVAAVQIFVGNPVAIRNASVITLRRQSGANLVVVGQREDVATGLSVSALVSFAASARASGGRIVLLDGTTPDSATAGTLQSTMHTLKLTGEIPNYRDCDAAILQLGQEVAQRIADGRQDQPPILLMVHGLQRFRTLRKDEDDFSMSSDGPPKPDKVFGAILRDGPGVGVHVFVWADTAPSLQRCIDRNALREFDWRVLMQMSANDSSYLMDTPAASRLGADRALIFSEEKGTTERFRPFEIAGDQVLGAMFD